MKMKPPMPAATKAYMAKKKYGSGAADDAGQGAHDAFPYGANPATPQKSPAAKKPMPPALAAHVAKMKNK